MSTIHVRPGEGRHYPMIDGDHIAKATVQDACGAFEVFESIAPAAPMAHPHVSPWTSVLFLLEGRITAVVGGTSYDVEPGGGGRLPGGDLSHLRRRRRVCPVRGGHLRRWRRAVLRRLRRLRAGGPACRRLDGGDPLGNQTPRRCARRRLSCAGAWPRQSTLGDPPESPLNALAITCYGHLPPAPPDQDARPVTPQI